jgi:hypothetical protein
MTEILCPTCHGGVLTRGQGRLDQSGDCYLETVVFRCARCEYTRYEPAVRARWRSAAEPETAKAVARRAA